MKFQSCFSERKIPSGKEISLCLQLLFKNLWTRETAIATTRIVKKKMHSRPLFIRFAQIHSRLLDTISHIYRKDLMLSQEGLACQPIVHKERKKVDSN
jgi:hypothetical protein